MATKKEQHKIKIKIRLHRCFGRECVRAFDCTLFVIKSHYTSIQTVHNFSSIIVQVLEAAAVITVVTKNQHTFGLVTTFTHSGLSSLTCLITAIRMIVLLLNVPISCGFLHTNIVCEYNKKKHNHNYCLL